MVFPGMKDFNGDVFATLTTRMTRDDNHAS